MKKNNTIQTMKSPEHKRRLFSGVAWYFFSNLFPAFSSLLIFSLASRIITPAELGAVTLAATITTILTSFCAVGFGDAIIQLKELNRKHLDTVFFIGVISSVSIYLVSVSVVEFADFSSFTSVFKSVYPVIAIKIIIDSCAIVPLSYLTRSMEFKAIAIRTMYCSIAAVLLCVPVLYFGGGIWAIVLSQVATSLISFLILTFSAGLKLKPIFYKKYFNELKSFGLTTTCTKMVTSISVDNVIIGFYGSVVTLGIYAFSRRVFGSIADILNNAIANVTYPLYASVQDNLVELKKVFFKTTFFSTLLSLPAFTGLIIISPYLIPLVFGSQWLVAIPVIQVCCLIGFVSCIGSIQMSLIKGLGRTSWILKYQLFQQLSTAVLVFAFAKDGALALMLAIAIKTFIVWPYTVYYIARILQVRIRLYLLNFLKPVLSVVLMYVCCKIVEYMIIDYGNFMHLLILILIGISSYSLCIYILARNEIAASINTVKKK
ncbi:lipopolysaccharide biosynthesis protein [Kluyvera ascorbata]|uniref:lipopolysaccharide biosynthesis protein n=1 Tax=Kluyvera ascorbata TaxID=51288 RepID=UPI0022DF9B2E|nr:lipopolysaccharide biosynthesis protein [Kluyvera ascorbata]